MHEIYDEDYYERGLETGKSIYQNYRWMPEWTIPIAMVMIDCLGIKRGQTVLDYGCAKGYLVKALRLLGRDAHGVDISEYAIKNVDAEVRKYCVLKNDFKMKTADFCISKDVFEHISEAELPEVLAWIDAHELFAVIALGDENGYFAPAANLDKTHITCKDGDWWCAMFIENGWKIKHFAYRIAGIKDSYNEISPTAHGFFTLRKINGSLRQRLLRAGS